MTALGVYAEFLTLQQLYLPGDPAGTAAGVLESMPAFRRSVLALLVILVLDVVVAWGLYEYLAPVSRGLSLLTAWLRLVYAAILGVALGQLIELLTLVGEGLAGSDVSGAAASSSAALTHLEAYYAIWGVGLIVFGFHLAGLGVLVVRSGYVPKVFGVLLLLAGLGYVSEYSAIVMWPDFSVPLSSAGWAEPLFLLWLLWAGRPTVRARAGVMRRKCRFSGGGWCCRGLRT